jgi:cbb3-type cytochrome oxidase subunit 3
MLSVENCVSKEREVLLEGAGSAGNVGESTIPIRRMAKAIVDFLRVVFFIVIPRFLLFLLILYSVIIYMFLRENRG